MEQDIEEEQLLLRTRGTKPNFNLNDGVIKIES